MEMEQEKLKELAEQARQGEPAAQEALLAAAEDGQPLEELLPVRLSTQDRQALLWRMEDQLSYTEMARRLGISETGCRSRVARAVARCRLLLKDE